MIPGSVTRFPNSIAVFGDDSIFADLSTTENPLELWQALYDFEQPLDTGGADSEWQPYGSGTFLDPPTPFGVVELEPIGGLIFGFAQEKCQGFDFTRGTDLWYRGAAAQTIVTSRGQLWMGMVDSVPQFNDDEFTEACVFHVLNSGQIDLEFWSNNNNVQTLSNLGTFPGDGTYQELAYHYDGTNIEAAIDGVTVGREAVLTIPDVPLHGLMGAGDVGPTTESGLFDYFYAAQLRQPL